MGGDAWVSARSSDMAGARERLGLPPFAVDDIGQPRERRGVEFDEARSAFQPNEKMLAYRAYLRQQQQFKQTLARSARIERTIAAVSYEPPARRFCLLLTSPHLFSRTEAFMSVSFPIKTDSRSTSVCGKVESPT